MPLPIMAPLAAAAAPAKGAGTVASALAPVLGASMLFGGGQQGAQVPGMMLPAAMPPGLMAPDISAAEMLPTEPILPTGGVPPPTPPSELGFPSPGLLSPTLAADPLLADDPLLSLSRRGPRGPSSASVLLRMLLG